MHVKSEMVNHKDTNPELALSTSLCPTAVSDICVSVGYN
jgi:hypothetical protein